MSKEFEIRGFKELSKAIDRKKRACGNDVKDSVKRALLIVRREALILVTGPMRAIDTGLMRSTLTSYLTKATKNVVEGETGYVTDYAYVVHEGKGKHEGNPRRTLTTALNNREKIARSEVKKGMNSGLRS